MENFVRNQ